MKRIATIMIFIGFVWVHPAFSAPRFYNYMGSAEGFRTLNRNASTESDAVFYNPAGTVLMEDGLYIHFSNQTAVLLKKVEDSTHLGDMGPFPDLQPSYKCQATAMAIPYLYLTYKKENYSIFGGVFPIGGTGTGKFDDGIPSLEFLAVGAAAGRLGTRLTPGDPGSTATGIHKVHSSIEAMTAYFAAMAGGAIAVTDKVSVAAGYYLLGAGSDAEIKIRQDLTTAANGFQSINMESDFEQKGSGVGVMVGMDIRPNQDWNIGMKFEYFDKMELEYHTKRDDLGLFPDGKEIKQTLPMNFNLGVSHQLTDRLKLESSFNYSFDSETDWDGQEENMENGWSIGLAAEYAINPDLIVSAGYLFASAPYTRASVSDLDYDLDTHCFATGASYRISPKLRGTIGVTYSRGLEAQGMPNHMNGVQTYNQSYLALSIGFTYRFFL
ncbi:MAG: outer membrane protein transport protein [Proteobacteria bacterium]|nr:outer membrane protein transport protein [Pseudomonadota bacterium]